MRAKHTWVDEENRLRGTEKGGWVVRGLYQSSFMKLFARRHEMCTVFSFLPEKKEAGP
jgi:hypothetical protein